MNATDLKRAHEQARTDAYVFTGEKAAKAHAKHVELTAELDARGIKVGEAFRPV